VAFVRTVKTASGARAVQIVYSWCKGARRIEHIGSAHDEVELELVKAAAWQRIAAGHGELDLGLAAPPAAGGPLPITASRRGQVWEGLSRGYEVLGVDAAAGADEVCRDLVLARIIEPTSKLDSLRVLEEIGIAPVSYATLKRRLPGYGGRCVARAGGRAVRRAPGVGSASLVLFDLTTRYFETDTGDGFREPGFSTERRLEPQITVGLLSDATGFPLMVSAFEATLAQTTTMLPTIAAIYCCDDLKWMCTNVVRPVRSQH